MPPSPINGTSGNDNPLNGTSGDDTINGLGGADRIYGLDGNDVIDGGSGNDIINGGAGNDSITGGTGNDNIVGGTGNDTANYVLTSIAAASTGGGPIGFWSGAILTLVTGAEGTDVLNQVESLNFNGQTFAVHGYNGTGLPYNVIANLGSDSNSVNDGGASVSGNVLANDYDVDSALTVTGAQSNNNAAGPPAMPSNDPKAQADPSFDVTGAYGTLHINADGTYTYTTSGSGSGVDHFQYSVSDGGVTKWVNLDITVNHVNHLPVASAGSASTSEDNAVSGAVSATDADHDTLTYSLVSGPQHGSIDFHSDGTYTYTPNADYHGSDSFYFRANDGHGNSNTAQISLSVSSVNDDPVAYGASVGADEDTGFSGQVSASDADGDSLTYSVASGPSHGSLSFNSDGAYSYTPDANYHGSDSFDFTVNDGHGGTATATVTIDIASVNDAPVSSDASFSGNEDSPISGQVSATDADGDSLTYAVADGPSHGSLVFNSDGSFTYTPEADFHGSDSFTFEALDGETDGPSSTVYITVNSVNDAPTASGGSNSVDEDETLTGSVAGGDVDNDPLTFYVVSGPSHGSLSLNSDGTYTYIPDSDYNGSDSFTFRTYDGTAYSDPATVNLTVNPGNDSPVASTGSVSTDEDTTLSGSLSASDADGDSLTYSLASQAGHGSVSVNSDGSYTYTPDANYHGSDSFDFTVSDGHGGSSTATVYIDVVSVNDAPSAADGSASTDEDTSVSGQVSASDVDGDSLTYSVASGPSHGSLSLNSDGTYTYIPDANYHGSDSFDFTVSDGHGGSNTGHVTIDVAPVNDDPVASPGSVSTDEDTAVSGSVSATDVDGDSLTYIQQASTTHGSLVFNSDGTFTYTPDPDYHGSDSFTYTADDGHGGTSTVGVTITVNPVNDAPSAADGSASTAEDTSVSGQVSATDVDGDSLTYSVASGPSHGSLSLNSDGTYTYIPDANYHGSDSFDFTVSDGHGGSNTGHVTIDVASVNDDPSAADGSASGDEDTTISGTLHATDVDGDSLTYSTASGPSHGSLTVNSDGTYSYVPNANYNGSDSFDFMVSDGHGGVGYGHISLTIPPVNDDPIAYGASVGADEDTGFSGQVSASDADGDSLTYSVASGPSHGSLSFNSDGAYSYTPDANYHGSDSFTFQADDGHGGTATATVTIDVASVNDLPVNQAGSFSTNEDTTYSGSVHATDADGDTLTYHVSGSPNHGSVVMNSDGTFTYTPDANYHGSDSFYFVAEDGEGGGAAAQVTINVASVNDAPVAAGGSASTNEDSGVSGQVSASDVDGDSLTYTLASGPSHGSLSFHSDGSYTYIPNADYNGSDSFDFTVSDGHGGSNTGHVTIDVVAQNDIPSADAAGPYSIGEDATLSGQATGSDVDDDTLTWSVVSGLDGLTFNTDGSWSFSGAGNATAQALNDGESATLSFSYHAWDGAAFSNTVTVTLNVSGALEVVTGTALRDVLNGSAYGDSITGLGGNDDLYGQGGNDTIQGNDGADKLYGGDGSDSLYGGNGNDTVNGDAGNDLLEGNDGNDTMDGGDGNDSVSGGEGADVVKGGAGNDSVYGGNGDDTVQGGAGDDFIYAGAGKDTISGGGGADTFVFAGGDLTSSAATSDIITDFKSSQGDILDLSGIDANTNIVGDQAFSFVGSFTSHAGEMTLSYNSGTNVTTVGLDTNGDGTADYVLSITGNVNNPNGWLL